MEQDSSYAEIVISDSLVWAYHESAGVVAFDYELGDNRRLRRFYVGTRDPLDDWLIKKFSYDTISVASDSKYEFTLHRVALNLDIEKVVNQAPPVVDLYIDGLRNRGKEWRKNESLEMDK